MCALVARGQCGASTKNLFSAFFMLYGPDAHSNACIFVWSTDADLIQKNVFFIEITVVECLVDT